MAPERMTEQDTASMQEEIRRLRRAVEELSILNDLARAIGASVNAQEIMQTIVHRSLRAVSAEQGVITLVDESAKDPMKTLVRTAITPGGQSKYHLHEALLGWMFINKKPLLIADPPRDERFKGMRWDPSIRSLLCVPLLIKSVLKGVLTVYNKVGSDAFSDEDQRLLAIISAQSAQVVENARLYELELSLNRMKEELRVAAAIQDNLLPRDAPSVPGFDIAGRTVPAQMVGGDYFDFIPVDGTRLAVCLGDVSGKGLPAALLMANVQATLRGQTQPARSALDCITRANQLLHVSTGADKFITMFYGILDTQKSTLQYCNAGHDNPVLLRRSGDIIRLGTGGVVLSILETFPYEEDTVSMQPGDMLVMYSDGVAEAANESNELFGDTRLIDILRAHAARPATDVIDAVVGSLFEHAGAVPQADDITLIVVRATGRDS